jgi:secreted PhoX family phosphatase
VPVINRRSFLKSTAAAAASVPFHALIARAATLSGSNARVLRRAGYGPLVDVLDDTTGLPLVKLPEGFRYVSFGWAGDLMADGRVTPGNHDGMGAFAAGTGRIRLVRNHETDKGPPFMDVAYDREASGGTTTLEFDTDLGRFISARGSLSGTMRNCAGGMTPWGSWLTAEETTEYGSRPHGYVFEVPADGAGDPAPLCDMGRFSHEAVAFDPATGYLYETEDPGTSVSGFLFGGSSKAGFYRFVPNVHGRLSAGGRLFMLKVAGRDKADFGKSYPNGATFDVDWVPIDRPDTNEPGSCDDFVWDQGRARGAAAFARLEGCWYGNERVYIVSTNGGIGLGQIWEYSPGDETISLLFESPAREILNKPDHITVSPRGGIVLCEDGSGDEYLHGLTRDGEIFPFALNNVKLRGERNGLSGNFTSSEWAGPCYSPDGKWLFVNIFSPGITLAITGPWQSGAL